MKNRYPILLSNFIGQEDCSLVIELIDNLNLEKKLKKTFSDNDGRNLIWNYNNEKFNYIIKKYTKKIIEINDKNLIIFPHKIGLYIYDKGPGLGIHSDIMGKGCNQCVLSAIIYLNDEYEGGEINFPKLNIEIKPLKYDVLFFPTHLSEYDHRVKSIISGKRYVIPMCFTTNINKSSNYYL